MSAPTSLFRNQTNPVLKLQFAQACLRAAQQHLVDMQDYIDQWQHAKGTVPSTLIEERESVVRNIAYYQKQVNTFTTTLNRR